MIDQSSEHEHQHGRKATPDNSVCLSMVKRGVPSALASPQRYLTVHNAMTLNMIRRRLISATAWVAIG